MDKMSPSNLIKTQMDSYATGEEKIARYILEHYEEIIHINIGDISKDIDVSESSIVRFTKKLGYSGFRDFKYACAQDVSENRVSHYDELEIESTDYANVMHNFFLNHISNIQNNLKQLNTKTLSEVAELIDANDNLYIVGAYLSGNLAQNLYYRLRLLYKNVFLIDSFTSSILEKSWLGEGDLVIAISQSGETDDVITFVHEAKKKGAHIISFTTSMNSSLYKMGDYQIIPVSNYSNRETKYIDTESIMKLIFDSLYIYLLMKKEKQDGNDKQAISDFWFR